MKENQATLAAKALQNQINLLVLAGGGFVLMGQFCPGIFARTPWAPGAGVILMGLNIHCYFRRLRRTMDMPPGPQKCEQEDGLGR